MPIAQAEEKEERAGIYLASLFALMLPLLIVLAITLPNNGPFSGGAENSSTGTGLDSIDVNGQDVETVDGVSVEVAGATQRTGDQADADGEIEVEIGEAVQLEATAGDTNGNETSTADNSTSNEANDSEANDTDAEAVQIADTSGDDDTTSDAGDPTEAPTATSTSTPSTTEKPAETTTTSTTKKPATTSTRKATTTTAPTTSTSTTTTSTTTTTTTSSTTTTTTTTAAPTVEPVDFAQRIDIGRIGETSLQFRFSSAATTTYKVSVRAGSTVVKTSTGTATANTLVNASVQGLTPGTDYTVQVTLNGPPVANSPRVAFRTSGGTPEPAEAKVSMSNVGVVDVQATRFQVNYASNICANGSFVIREQGGGVVGSNAGQASGCTTRHLAIPGFWTPKLKPNTVYTITITVEANGAGKGGGNKASRTLTVTTSS